MGCRPLCHFVVAAPSEAFPPPRPMVSLEPLHVGHAPLLVEAARESVADVGPWLPWCTPSFDRAAAEAWVREQVGAWERGTAYEFAFVGEGGRYLGGGGVNHVRADHRFANVGYWVRSSEAGRGVATEALGRMVAWARANTDLNRLEVVVAVGNRASGRVAEKAGARREGVAAARLFLHGRFHDAVVYAFSR